MKRWYRISGMTIPRFIIAGFSIGIAAGFAYWVFNVPPSGMPYLSGTSRIGSQIDTAMSTAGTLWFRALLAGGVTGGIIALFFTTASVKLQSLFELTAVSATGVYLLALRGAWSAPRAESMPILSWLLPVILAIITASLLAYYETRAMRSRAEDISSPALIVILHVCLSLGAAHIMMQLPYTIGCIPAFFSNLRDIAFLLTGF